MASLIIHDQDMRVGVWVYARTGGTFSAPTSRCLGLERNGSLVAGVVYEGWNGASMKVHIAGDGKYWLNRRFLRAMFSYPFSQLGAKKLIGIVDSTNKAALKFDKNLGFTEEALIKDASVNGDLVILTMTKEQCRFIKG